MTISVIIPAHNEEHYVGDCLDSLIEEASERIIEILVVDNASTDRTSAIASERRGVRVVYEARQGITCARQRGLDEATGALVAYIDADTRVPKGWLRLVERIFHERSDVVCLSGPYRYFDGSRIARWLLNAICWGIPPIGFRLFSYMVIGGNFVARKNALLAIGGFDTKIDFYGEDTDIGRRLNTYGRVLYLNSFFVYTSVRRFYGEGFIATNARYFINFLWVVFFKRPFSNTHQNIRLIVPEAGFAKGQTAGKMPIKSVYSSCHGSSFAPPPKVVD
jgi:glycosyltransferase involved in cell wall biosynthesis